MIYELGQGTQISAIYLFVGSLNLNAGCHHLLYIVLLRANCEDSHRFVFSTIFRTMIKYCAYLSSCHRTASDANCWTTRTLFIAVTTSWLEESAPPWEFPMFLWISSNSCPLNLLLVRSHQAEIIIVKRLIQGRNNVTRVGVELRSCDLGRR